MSDSAIPLGTHSGNTRLAQTIARLKDPDRGAQLAQLAAEQQVRPDDPLWAALEITLLGEQWSRENVAALERAANAIRDQITAATAQSKQQVLDRALAASRESEKAIEQALNRLAVETGYEIQSHAQRAIREVSVGGWRGWAMPILAAVVVGVVATGVTPLAAKFAEQRFGMSQEDREALQTGRAFDRTWYSLSPAEQDQVLTLLKWKSAEEATPPKSAEATKEPKSSGAGGKGK